MMQAIGAHNDDLDQIEARWREELESAGASDVANVIIDLMPTFQS